MERRRTVAGTGTEGLWLLELFSGYLFFLVQFAKGWHTGVLLDGHRVDDTMGGLYRLGAALL